MKNIGIFIAVMLISTLTAFGQKDKVEVKVDGLGCPFCAYGLEKKFKDLKGIKKIKIDLEKGIMNFTVPATNQVSVKEIVTRVETAGYTPMKVTINRANGKVVKMKEKNSKTTSSSSAANLKKATFKVYGNCGMCQSRIEKAAKGVQGVTSAAWDEDTKMLKLTYDTKKTSVKSVKLKIAAVGHDTDTYKAKKKVYDNLHGCCQYKRPKS